MTRSYETPVVQLANVDFRLKVEIVINGEWRVVAKFLRFIDRRRSRKGSEARSCKLVVKPPTNVLGICLPPIAPPRVTLIGGVWM